MARHRLTFHCFPKLPLELRLVIWVYAMPERTVKLVPKIYPSAKVRVAPDSSPIVNCCQESRRETRKVHYHGCSTQNWLLPKATRISEAKTLEPTVNFYRDTISVLEPRQYLELFAGRNDQSGFMHYIRFLKIERVGCSEWSKIHSSYGHIIQCLRLFKNLELLIFGTVHSDRRSRGRDTDWHNLGSVPGTVMRRPGVRKLAERIQALVEEEEKKHPMWTLLKLEFLQLR